MVMAMMTRIFSWSLLIGGLGAGLGLACFGQYAYSEYMIPVLGLAGVGGIIGAVAGAAREIATALRPETFEPGKPTTDAHP
jgi:hypothetical protein